MAQITLENLEVLLSKLRLDVKQDLQDEIKKMEEKTHKKINELEKNQNEIKIQTNEHENRISYLEKELRKRNVIVHGIKEVEENKLELENMIKDFMKQNMKINFELDEVDFMRRLGPKSNDRTKIRPIQIQLTTMRKRNEILANKKNLKNSTIYITEDLSKIEREERKKLIPIMEKFRNDGKHAIIKNNILFVDRKPLKNLEMYDKNDKKRQLSAEEDPREESSNYQEKALSKKANIEEGKVVTIQRHMKTREHSTVSGELKQRQRSKSLASFSGDIRKFIADIEQQKDE